MLAVDHTTEAADALSWVASQLLFPGADRWVSMHLSIPALRHWDDAYILLTVDLTSVFFGWGCGWLLSELSGHLRTHRRRAG
jgi:hypothetical protein